MSKRIITYNTLCIPKQLGMDRVVEIKEKLGWLLYEPEYIDGYGWMEGKPEVLDLEENNEPLPLIFNYSKLTKEQQETINKTLNGNLD